MESKINKEVKEFLKNELKTQLSSTPRDEQEFTDVIEYHKPGRLYAPKQKLCYNLVIISFFTEIIFCVNRGLIRV